MKKSLYFPHDYNARNDIKLQSLMSEQGVAGIGIYWCLVEMLYEQGGKLPLSACKGIAYTLRVGCKCIANVIQKHGLFEYDSVWFWSPSVVNRTKTLKKLSETRKFSAMQRWNRFQNDTNQSIDNQQEDKNPTDANALHLQSKSNALAMHSQCTCYAIKIKENKESISNEIPKKADELLSGSGDFCTVKKSKKNEATQSDEKKQSPLFRPPSVAEVQAYIGEKGYHFSAEEFCDFYASKNWFVGKNKMRDWKAAVRNWERRRKEQATMQQQRRQTVIAIKPNDEWQQG